MKERLRKLPIYLSTCLPINQKQERHGLTTFTAVVPATSENT